MSDRTAVAIGHVGNIRDTIDHRGRTTTLVELVTPAGQIVVAIGTATANEPRTDGTEAIE